MYGNFSSRRKRVEMCSFAFRNPPDNSLGVKWAPYDLKKQEYLNIGNQLITGHKLLDEEVKFWEDIFRNDCSNYVF